MGKLPISVHILTWNSEQTLERAITSVLDCAEVLVIDGGSQDGTVAIAERLGARVIPQRFPGAQGQPLMNFSAARNVGLEHTTQPWVLCLDSDEVMDPEAMKEIQAITTSTNTAAYLVPRKYVMEDGTVVQRASTYPNMRIYFFHRDAVDGWQKPVHERVRLKPDIVLRRLHAGSLAPLAPLGVFRSKLTQYLKIEVEESRGKGWLHWFRRIVHTVRSRLIATIRLLWIWLTPGFGARLPLSYEWARFWYGWKLVVMTCPAFL
ncbi:glycosyltransferase family 2 protein [Candidatus Peribacteria bacterium]|nr:glycosyltransferase family 2 protein [Candidatus Peribacteria bacterium]